MENRLYNSATDAYAQFGKWLGQQPFWLQDATYRIYHGKTIGEKQIDEYVKMCVSQAKKECPPYSHMDASESFNPDSSASLSVVSISNIVGVNALAEEACLDFSCDGVTAVYGLNGAGKSGFMRIFKQLSGSPFEEVIQPNVYKNASIGKSGCTITVIEDGQEKVFTCDLSSREKNTPLSACDVFDTRISNYYISKNNNVSYQPFVFSVLSELAVIAGKIARQIDRYLADIPASSIKIPEEFAARDDIAWIRTINLSSVFPEQYSTWTDEQQRTIDTVAKMLDTENVSTSLRLCQSHLATLRPIYQDLSAMQKGLHSGTLIDAHSKAIEAKRKLEVAEKLFSDTADEL